ncbi:MAG: LysM peptidoglycan-binding domain-containing protein [Bacteroidetes bacterium]|nr:LysM peptidoglycan-binding domain-containing protein [Bacteroidota bacterium]
MRIFLTKAFQLSLAVLILQGWAHADPGDSLRSYSYIHHNLNVIQYFNKEVLKRFHDKWNSSDRLVITHFGDSHVQPDIYPGAVRKELQSARGNGGFGMTFPYSTVRTYSMIDYRSVHTGTWLYSKSIEPKPKLPLGVSGATARTFDPQATFALRFKKPYPSGPLMARIFCKVEPRSFDFILRSGGQETLVEVGSQAPAKPIEILLNSPDSVIELKLARKKESQNTFEFYGMSLEDPGKTGVVHHCLGIGGSKYGSLLEQVLLEEQLPVLAPDLVILDFGTNDILYQNAVPLDLKAQIEGVIRKVRRAVPEATILLTSAQDMYRRDQNITASMDFSDLIRQIAKEQQCLMYDWFWVAGGPETMLKWRDQELARKDMIHLTIQGYELKGRLLGQAILEAVKNYDNGPDSVLVSLEPFRQRKNFPDTLRKDSTQKMVAQGNAKNASVIRHQIKKGETLKVIAKHYHVKVEDIRRDNGLANNRIIEGKYLVIHPGQKPVAKSPVPSSADQTSQKYLTHLIKSGETLSEIAEQYKVSVAQLKQLNGLRSSNIRAGKTLKIKAL